MRCYEEADGHWREERATKKKQTVILIIGGRWIIFSPKANKIRGMGF